MPEEVKLKPCPFCGSSDIVYVRGLMQRLCMGCKSEGPEKNSKQDVDSMWNLRTPEPGTSVIRWTRYDGTPETLPKEGRIILVSPKEAKLIIPVFAVVYNGTFTMNMTTPEDSEAHVIEKKAEVGDLWAYLPEPPEGME